MSEGAGAPVSLPLEVRGRGISRRIGGFCNFPPLQRLRFGDKDAIKNTVFKGQKKLKLVTSLPGLTTTTNSSASCWKYLTYRIYGVLTPMSYRVRLAEVTYRTDDKDKGVTRFGFLIEDDADLADRNKVKRAQACAAPDHRPAVRPARRGARDSVRIYDQQPRLGLPGRRRGSGMLSQ